jgi:hypothetical protein
VGGNHGTLAGGTSFGSGQVGQAFVLGGSGANVEIPAHSSLDVSGRFTVEFWAQPLTHAASGLLTRIDNGISGAGWSFPYHGTSGGAGGPQTAQFQVVAAGDDETSAAGAVPFDRWTHVAGTSDGTTMRFFVNGVQVWEGPSPAVAPSPFSILIGAYQRNGAKEQFFTGRIDEVGVYSRALEPAEIRSIAMAGRGGLCRTP